MLELGWVSLDILKFLSIAESNVFETVDLTELPENWAAVLALALDLEDFSEIGLFTDTLNHMLQKLRF